ncbi:MAG: DUF3300 domain-containing protein [Phycisphaerales bacterium]
MKLVRASALLIAAAVAAQGAFVSMTLAVPQSTATAPPPAGDKPPFKPEELEQMLAPIALYPDSLLSQVLMASTYPIEVVEADRWVKAHADLKGDALAAELEKQTWDPSVRSLVNFPQVLAMMSENLSTTVKIGDAFIGQQKEVMDTVQKLRLKADATGNLKSSKEQTVVKETTDTGAQVIVIQSPSPQVVYVPTYNPTVVYGAWPYPAYPPYPYYPPGYVASNVISFGVGVACGVAWGYAWGHCNWNHGDVNVNINQNNNFNQNINRNNFQNINNKSWNHDPAHRQGAAYRNSDAANRVGAGTTNNRAAQARNDYRGKADAGRADIARGGADGFKGNAPGAGAGDRQGAGAGNRPGAGTADRGGVGSGAAGSRGGAGASAGTRDVGGGSAGSNRGGAFGGSSQSGAAARSDSQRGNASRASSPSTRAAPSRSSSGMSGGSRGGGGGGGGGARGGGGRR